MTDPNRPGIVTCPTCGRDVPDTLFCVNCGFRLKGEVIIPPLKDRERQILEEMLSRGGISSVPDIYRGIRGSKEYIRVILLDLVRYGLVEKPSRGKYTVSKLGESALKIEVDMKIKESPEHAPIILIETPKILRAGTMVKIFKRAGGTRMARNGFITLALVLEQIGDEIAQEAVAIVNNDNRRTVKVEDMDQAIGTVLPKSPREVN